MPRPTIPGSTRHPSGLIVTRVAAACVAAVAALGLSACGGNSGDAGAAAPSSASPSASMSGMSMPPSTSGADPGSSSAVGMSDMIMIQGFKFSIPASVPAGSAVEVMNLDSEAHSVTADGGEFDVTVPPGKTVEITAPSQPGSYPFHCKFHSNMHATLRVS